MKIQVGGNFRGRRTQMHANPCGGSAARIAMGKTLLLGVVNHKNLFSKKISSRDSFTKSFIISCYAMNCNLFVALSTRSQETKRITLLNCEINKSLQ